MRKTAFKAAAENLKANWLFPIGALAFFFLRPIVTAEGYIGLLVAVAISLAAAMRMPPLWERVKNMPIEMHVVSVLTAAGICREWQSQFYAFWSNSSLLQRVGGMLPFSLDIPAAANMLAVAAAMFFLYICLLAFWKEMRDISAETGLFRGIDRREAAVYLTLLVLLLALVTFCFTHTNAFYVTEYDYDVIYTSDSTSLVRDNAYLVLNHPENDLRQPLFAVFSAPFMGIPHLLGSLLGGQTAQAMLMNYVQAAMLLAANFMLSRMMGLGPKKRILFMILSSCCYSTVLFALMMEQYIIAYFWLAFCLYLICARKQPSRIALWGAGGTLLTSMALLPFLSEHSPVKQFGAWLKDMVRLGVSFIVLMLAFCRFDVFYHLAAKVTTLGQYAGQKIGIMERMCQFTEFVRSCFLAPAAGVNTAAVDHISWQMEPAARINVMGVAMLILAAVSAFVNRKKKSSLLAAFWTAFSLVMLFGLGWGMQENGLILYALYFGWAFLVLLFQLMEALDSRLGEKWFLPVCCAVLSALMLAVNLPAIAQMVAFAVAYFPV